MKRIAILFALALTWLVADAITPSADAQTLPARTQYQSFGGFPSLVASNMTTNVTCGGIPVYRDRGVSILCIQKTVTNEATALVVSFECSTNRPNDTVTNWFRPRIPLTATFTNHSGIISNWQFVYIPPSSFDNFNMIRPWAFQNTATTNGWTNILFGATSIP